MESFDQKISVFSARAPPSKVVYIGAKGAFRKILGSVGQKWIYLKVAKGGLFGSAGGRIPKEKELRSPVRKTEIVRKYVNEFLFEN